MIVLLALSDSGAPAYDREHAAALAALGVPAFACTPDAFPDLLAVALTRGDVAAWAAARGHRRRRHGPAGGSGGGSEHRERITPVSAVPSVSYSITVRLEVPAGGAAVSQLTTAVEHAGGAGHRAGRHRVRPSSACGSTSPARPGTPSTPTSWSRRCESVPGVVIGKVSDRTFLMHLGGKIEMQTKHPIRNRDDLSMIYTPGVARVCLAIAKNPEDARRLTVKRNSIAVVTDGSAVLGLGNIGPRRPLPVMEGKAALFKRFAGIDAWPLCLDTQDVDEIIAVVRAVAPGFAGINLEDISAPRCFEVEARLREQLDIPVFHDDQHGTAIVVLAALYNALRVVRKALGEVKIVMSGAGRGRDGDHPAAAGGRGAARGGGRHRRAWSTAAGTASTASCCGWPSTPTNSAFTGTLKEAVVGADVFIGVSGPGVLIDADVAAMADQAMVFALANPEPEIDPAEAVEHAAVVATGRSDFPNQINNVLAFPGVFRGLLDAQSAEITPAMLLAAAKALAAVVTDDELNAAYIMPERLPRRRAPSCCRRRAHRRRWAGRTPDRHRSRPVA